MLIGQNTDPEISETSIRNEMAQAYLALGEYEKGLEILKQYNPLPAEPFADRADAGRRLRRHGGRFAVSVHGAA